MNKIFNIESKFVQGLATIGNLVILNLLWILTSIPIITIGASTTAMYSVAFKYADNTDDAVIKPYFKAFVSNFKQSTLIWIPMCIVSALLVIDALYLLGNANEGATPFLWIPFFVVLMVLMVTTAHVFPQIARYQVDTRTALHNTLLMSILHFLLTAGVVGLNLLPWIVMIILPEVMAYTGIFWVMFGASAIAYFNAKVLLKMYKKHEPAPEQDEETQ